MKQQPTLEAYWSTYLRSLPEQDRNKTYYEALSFGTTPQEADKILVLVLQGTKTATSMSLWELELQGKTLWNVGDEHIVLDGAGNPRCIIQTTELRITPFQDVDAQFAYGYGEGDQTLTWWRKEMWTYYVEDCQRLGKQAREDMPLICERFKVVYS